jgi:hypothetical protein
MPTPPHEEDEVVSYSRAYHQYAYPGGVAYPEEYHPLYPPAHNEEGGEFGGLVSYFSSQREDDLDT